MTLHRIGLSPANGGHFARLISFAETVFSVCVDAGIQPVLSGSLAVFVYTGDVSLNVNDIDLSCPEAEFDRLAQKLTERGIECRLKPWHVLQARRSDLKVEFDSQEHWMRGLGGNYERLLIGEREVLMVSREDLKELYRRGLETSDVSKRQALWAKYLLI